MLEDNKSYLNDLNDAQLSAVLKTDGPSMVIAGAGSGKTRVLTSRIAHIVKQHKAFPNQILAVTFTNKAAKEMQLRVSKYLRKEATGLPWLGTFHSISAKLLRKHSDAVGLKSNFNILDSEDQKKLIKQVLEYCKIDKEVSESIYLNEIQNLKDQKILLNITLSLLRILYSFRKEMQKL